MGGGKIQLITVGKENSYLTLNPQISFFKSVYKKYSNFAMQSIKLAFDNNDSISFDKETRLKLKLEKNAELINTLFFEVKLPKITNYGNYTFHWIDNLGASLIKSARITIGGDIIEEYDSNFMYIYHNNYLNKEKKTLYDYLSGNNLQDEYIDIANVPIHTRDKIRVPLPFWFHRNIGLSLPIFALEYSDAIVEIVLRPLKELCLFKNTSSQITLVSSTQNSDNTTVTHEQVTNSQLHTNDSINLSGDDVLRFFDNNRWDLESTLDINYIFLDDSDRLMFKNSNLRYIVEPVLKTSITNVSGNISNRIKLYHQTKELWFVAQRNDVQKRNMWLNFTNLDDDRETNYSDYQNNFLRLSSLIAQDSNGDKSPLEYLGAFTGPDTSVNLKILSDIWSPYGITSDTIVDANDCYTVADIKNILDIWKYRPYQYIPYIGNSTYKNYTNSIIKEIEIFFDQVERVSRRDNRYFSLVEPYTCGLSNHAKEMLLYSFSLEPYNYQPTGKCNFSHIKEVTFNMTLKDNTNISNLYDNYEYNVYLYSKYYNILEIKSGIGELLFKS